MIIRKARRPGSYVRFQFWPRRTEEGDWVAFEWVRASYNGNDDGYVSIARLKPEAEWNGTTPKTIAEICGRRRAIGPTPCYYPDCDCTTEHDVEIRRQGDDAIRQRAEQLTKEWAEQDAWDNANLSRQGRSCEVNLFEAEYIRPPLVAVETNGKTTEVPRGPRPYHAGRFVGPPRSFGQRPVISRLDA